MDKIKKLMIKRHKNN